MASKNMRVFSLSESLRYGRIATTLAQGLGGGMVGKDGKIVKPDVSIQHKRRKREEISVDV